MKPTFTMLIGLPASGKSTWAKEHMDEDSRWLSSDYIRDELFGKRDTSPEENVKVFGKLHVRTMKHLLKGRNVIYDATNINKKSRINYLKRLNSDLAGEKCYKKCIWFLTDYELCCVRNKEREEREVVPDYKLKSMYHKFQPPHISEGWDEIKIIVDAPLEKYNGADMFKEAKKFEQHNPHHTLTLGEHLFKTASYIEEKDGCIALKWAAILHDVGKMKTQTKGEDGVCHYYNHENVGAYDSLFYVLNALKQTGFKVETQHLGDDSFPNVNPLLNISNLIYYHMAPYNWEKNEKAKERAYKLLGDEMFKQIYLLHEADEYAH